MSFLDVPGARLYYESQGEGPLLLLIGSPMDSTGFTPLAQVMAERYTVVTYDPRGIGKSTRDDADADITPEMQADDVHRLIESLGGGPVDYLGSSGGAIVGLALITAHPGDVRTLVAHEPPIVETLPDSAEVHAKFEEIYQTFLAQGSMPALTMFLTYAGLAGMGQQEDVPRWEPSPEQLATMEATNKVFFGHLIRQTTAFVPDLDALRTSPVRIVVGVGAASKGQFARRCAEVFARQVGLTPMEFAGDHGGFAAHAPEFAEQLTAVLQET
ncbi:alpha/beta hydrolase [Hamadaea sp. NPDC050747]|uniref:alpha/beta fold hydrolase n=1 Tax=Hamadaea sp. NPDC050747 TaxID=3155789 RepID=UPI00340F8267